MSGRWRRAGAVTAPMLLLLLSCEATPGVTATTAPDVGAADVWDGGSVPDVPDVAPEDVPPPEDLAPDVADDVVDATDTAPPPECTPDNAEYRCNDNAPCTVDTCVDGACVHTPMEPCCVTDADCDDGIGCTSDECTLAHDCVHLFADSFCCLTDADCADQDDCTEDLCVANTCAYPRASQDCPCVTATDCDDGNPCSADACAGGHCAYSAADGPGCCATAVDCAPPGDCKQAVCTQFTCAAEPSSTKSVWSATFDDTEIDGFTVEDDGSGAKWQLGTTQAISLPGALYFGRLPQTDYDVGKTGGAALSPTIGPLAAGADTLSLWIAPNVEPLFSVDHVRVELRPEGGAAVVLWSKDELKTGSISGWKSVDIDVSPWVGAPFRLAFVFDSVDGTNNHYEGVWVDDVRVTAPCE